MKKKWIAGSAHALIKKNGRYLILKRSLDENYAPGVWDIPGGEINYRESIGNALRREVTEEVGLKVRQKKLLFVYGNRPRNFDSHHFQMIFLCDYISGKVRLSQDHCDYHWIKLSELNKFHAINFLRAFQKDWYGNRQGAAN